ncbi:MAG: hypothetical protein KC619_05405 [Myxococcales bacterium]|nr:hypothetical protein [Myxococcales bacterium]
MRIGSTMTLVALAATLAALISGCRRHKPDGTEACTPGVVYAVACDDMGVGRCAGDPVLTVCDGVSSPATCAAGAGTVLAEDDDSGDGLCPHATATCPASGAFTVSTRAYGSSNFACDWRVEPVGGGGPLPTEDPDAGP